MIEKRFQLLSSPIKEKAFTIKSKLRLRHDKVLAIRQDII